MGIYGAQTEGFQALDALYAYMVSDPVRGEQVREAISSLSSVPVQTYLRRVLEQRGASASTCESGATATGGTMLNINQRRRAPRFTRPSPRRHLGGHLTKNAVRPGDRSRLARRLLLSTRARRQRRSWRA